MRLEIYPIPDEKKVRMLRKLALFWDGQWFLQTVQKFGLEPAIELNALVRTAFGRIETRTLLRAVGKPCELHLYSGTRHLPRVERTLSPRLLTSLRIS